MIGLGVVTETRELPSTKPIDRAGQTSRMVRTAPTLVTDMPLLPNWHQAREICDQLLRLILGDEVREIGESISLDRCTAVGGFRHGVVIRQLFR